MLTDLRLGLRLLLKDRWFTVTAALVLALGIAATNTVFTFANGALLRDMPFADPDRVVELGRVSYPDLQDWRAATHTFDGIGAANERPMNLSEEGRPVERWRGSYISANGFALLGRRPQLGRDFRAEDDAPGAAPVVMLGHDVWRVRYHADPAVVGRTIRVNGTLAVVIGVMPPGFEFPLNAKLWQPLAALTRDDRENRQAAVLNGFARLRPDVTRAQAQADLATVTATLARDFPGENRSRREPPAVQAFRSGIGAPVVAMLAAMIGAVGFVLLIACANVANLLLTRAAGRSREMSVRMSLGATRWRIVRQLLVESLLLALVAGVVALALSAAGISLFWSVVSRVPDPPPFWLQFPMDWRVYAFLAAICLGSAVIFGLAPALHTARTSIVEVLNEAGRGATGHRRSRRWTSALVVGQLALTLVLLTGAGIMMRNLLGLVRMDAGVNTSSLIRMGIDLPAQTYATREQRLLFYRQLDERLATTPGTAASIATAIPLGGAAGATVQIEHDRRDTTSDQRTVSTVTIGPRYFETLGAPIVAGRPLTATDGESGRDAAVVNQRFVDLHFGDGTAIGRRIRLGADGNWLTIVGVAANVRQQPPRDDGFDPVVYLPLASLAPVRAVLLARSASDVATVTAALRAQVQAIDGDLPVVDVRTVDEHLAMQRWGQRVFGSVFVVFAVIALVLAVVGLYAITAYSVAQRTQEIGVRLALGAGTRDVWWLVTRRASGQLALGLLIGGAGAAGVGRVIPAMLAGTSRGDAVTLALVSALLIATGLAACLIPARRAMRLDPVVALRTD